MKRITGPSLRSDPATPDEARGLRSGAERRNTALESAESGAEPPPTAMERPGGRERGEVSA